ncbi:N-acetyltransferase [Streptomyces alfalfae]|uniref:GNAT family N-acetyltransferase n=1 Tax=Streptomyces alfalfae TaxID=1642299 RepID=UPI0009A17AE1|nr:GNAT family N-acetyltransferase [Streptomyces alfalfae]AYA19002.1 N-acetyltransferase [Streptomyces fradiae]RXX36474.1 N-acetyltransferase [Streptomyces alfalfae]RZM90401.1 N-acetyltransferase [Streptomyces alfalfae]
MTTSHTPGTPGTPGETHTPGETRTPCPTTVLRCPVATVTATATTPALLLRSWREDDAAALAEGHRDDPTEAPPGAPAIRNETEGLRWIHLQQQAWTAGTRYAFAVLETRPDDSEGALLAHVVLKDAAPGSSSAEVGYWTAPRARGRGIAPRALETLTTWAFTTFAPTGLTHLNLLHQVTNLASCRVAQKTDYAYSHTLPPCPPMYPQEGHVHVARAPARPGGAQPRRA